MAFAGGYVGDEGVLAITAMAHLKSESLPQTGPATIRDHQALGSHSVAVVTGFKGNVHTSCNRCHVDHFRGRLPLHIGLKQLAHQAEPHPAVVRHVAQGILLMFVGIQAGGTKATPVRHVDVPNRRGMFRQPAPQPELLEDQP